MCAYTIVLSFIMWYLAKSLEESREFVTAAKILVKLRQHVHEIEETEKIVEKKNFRCL